MNGNYDIDAILEEVRRKREQERMQAYDSRAPYPPENAPQGYAPPRAAPRESYPQNDNWRQEDYAPRRAQYEQPREEYPPRRYEQYEEPRREDYAPRQGRGYDEPRYEQRGYEPERRKPLREEYRPYREEYRASYPPTPRGNAGYEEPYPARGYAPEERAPRQGGFQFSPTQNTTDFAPPVPSAPGGYRAPAPSRESYRPAAPAPREEYPPRQYEQPYDEPGRYQPDQGAYPQQGGYGQNSRYQGYQPEPYNPPAAPRQNYPPQTPQFSAAPPSPSAAPATRRTPKPSMDDLLQNFGEGVGLGKGIDPERPPIQPRRSAPIVGAPVVSPAPEMETLSSPVVSVPVYTPPIPCAPAFDPAPASPREGGYQAPSAAPGNFNFNITQPTGEFNPPSQGSFSGSAGAPVSTPVMAPPAESEPVSQPVYTPPPEATTVVPPVNEAASDFSVPQTAGQSPFAPPADEATKLLGGEEPLPQLPVEHLPLDPEDFQDDVDYDEHGTPADTLSSEEERGAIRADIKRAQMGLRVRFALTTAAFVGLLYLAFSFISKAFPLPPIMLPENPDTVRMFMIVNVAVVAITMLINSSTIGGGLVSMFTFKADNDSLISLAMIAAMAQGVALVVTPSAASEVGVQLYYCVPVLGLLFNIVGKMMMMSRIERNSRLVCSDQEKYVMRTIKSPDFARELSRGLPLDLPEITYSVKTKYVSGFLEASYAQDYAESINRVLVIICLLASIAVSVISYFVGGSLYVSLTVLSGLLAVCAPFTSTMVGNMPMLRAAKKLTKAGTVIAGYPVVEEYNSVKAVTFKAKELFPPDSITLSSMKVFQESLIEQAILDACSVICATDSPLAPIFQGMLGGNSKILKEAENIVFEDSMGLSAWVDGKRVLIGNAQLMQNHGVSTPSKDYEERYIGEGKDILYLSNSGELIAMFALSYGSDKRVAPVLRELSERGVALIVHSTDPNITPGKLSMLYSYPEHFIRIVPASLHADYERVMAPRGRAHASIVYSGSIMTMLRALGIIPRIKSAVTIGTAVQLLSTVIGYAIITFFAFFAGMANITFTLLLCYQLVWTVLVVLLSNLRRI